MRRLLVALVAIFAALGACEVVAQQAIPYFTGPVDAGQLRSYLNMLIQAINGGGPLVTTIYASSYGVVNDPVCSIDQTTNMVNAINAARGRLLSLPSGASICLKTASSTLQISGTMQIEGNAASLNWAAPAGSPIAPVIDVLASATNVRINNLSINHNYGSLTYASPTYFGANLWAANAIVIEGNGFLGDNLHVINGAIDNIGIGAINRSTNAAIANAPIGVELVNTTTATGGTLASVNNGAGIDNGSGGQVTITNAFDNGSPISFVNDLAAGANGVWNNLTSVNARLGAVNTGACLYNGSNNTTFNNIECVTPGGRTGIWMDQPTGLATAGTVLSNAIIHNPNGSCMYISGGFTGTNIQCQGPSQAGSTSYPGIMLDTSAGNLGFTISPLYIDGLNIYPNASGQGALQSYAIQSTGGNDVYGHISSGLLYGVTASTSLSGISHLALQTASLTGTNFSGTPLAIGTNAPASSLDVTTGNTLRVSGASGTAGVFPSAGEGIEMLWQGSGGINGNYGIIQAYDRGGSAWRLLDLEGANVDLNVGNGNNVNTGTGTLILGGPITFPSAIATGTKPTLTTGTCSGTSAVGGALAGTFSAASCAGGTYILSNLPTASNGYWCTAQDLTTTADTLTPKSSTATTFTFNPATTASSDTIQFHCMAF